MKKTFIFYTDWIDYTKEMNREEKGLFLETILAYQNGDNLPNDISPIKFIWTRIQKQLDEDNNKWSEELIKRKEAGKLGGLAKASITKQVLASASNNKQIIADNDNDNDNENVNKNKYLSKDKEQSSEIVKVDKRVLEIDLIIETIKNLNGGIVDDTVKKQRQYGKLIKDKMEKIQGFNGDYIDFITKMYNYSNEYQRQYFKSLESFYFNIAGIIAGIKTQIQIQQKEKPGIGRV